MAFNVIKYHIVQVDTRTTCIYVKLKLYYEMNGVESDSVQCIKDRGITLASNL